MHCVNNVLWKVPSGQIGSTWEWYHWIGLEKNINCYIGAWFFNFTLEYVKDFKVLICFMQKWIQPPACLDHGLHPPNCCSILVLIAGCWNSLLTNHNPKNNWCLSRIFVAWFGGKDRGLSTCKLWSKQAEGWIHLCSEAAQNFELLSNIQDQK
jgi:hypothetical protein